MQTEMWTLGEEAEDEDRVQGFGLMGQQRLPLMPP